MRIKFDFDQCGEEDVGFDSRHFREAIWKYQTVYRSVSIFGWDLRTLWRLVEIFRSFQQFELNDPDTLTWLHNYEEKHEFSPRLPVLQTIGIEEIDFWLQRVWQVWTTLVLEVLKTDGLAIV